jgi:hypothetical protein
MYIESSIYNSPLHQTQQLIWRFKNNICESVTLYIGMTNDDINREKVALLSNMLATVAAHVLHNPYAMLHVVTSFKLLWGLYKHFTGMICVPRKQPGKWHRPRSGLGRRSFCISNQHGKAGETDKIRCHIRNVCSNARSVSSERGTSNERVLYL